MSSETTFPNPIHKSFTTDNTFDQLYPVSIQLLAKRHWTPINITKMTVEFLVPNKNMKVLDIGSGTGKFCLAGAYFKPFASFFGVEQRSHLVAHAENVRKKLGLKNVHFLEQNFSQVDFNQFNHFYFFNSFYENLTGKEKIDDTISFSDELYDHYFGCLYEKLEEAPAETRLATYHSPEDKIPPCFKVFETQAGGLLKFWIKKE